MRRPTPRDKAASVRGWKVQTRLEKAAPTVAAMQSHMAISIELEIGQKLLCIYSRLSLRMCIELPSILILWIGG